MPRLSIFELFYNREKLLQPGFTLIPEENGQLLLHRLEFCQELLKSLAFYQGLAEWMLWIGYALYMNQKRSKF